MFSRRVEARITGYVSFDTTQGASKRTSKVYELFIPADLATILLICDFFEGGAVCPAFAFGDVFCYTRTVLERQEMTKKIRKRIKGVFLTGIAAIIPVGVTFYVLYLIIGMMNNLVKIIPARFHPDQLLPFHIPGLGVIITLILIFVAGLVTKSYLGNKAVSLGEKLVGKIPLVRGIYNALKQLVEAVLSDKGESFKRAVLLEYPRKGLYSVAFVTGESRGEVQSKTLPKCINLFVPTTPNPTSGFYIMVPEDDVVYLDMTVEDAFTLIISGGVLSPTEIKSNN